MKLTRLVMTIALLVGLAASVAAYRSASAVSAGAQPQSPVSAAEARPAPQVVQPGARFAWAPCPPKATLEKGVCVVDVVETVVVPAPTQVVALPSGSSASSSSSGGGGSTYAGDDGDEGQGDEGQGDDSRGDDGGREYEGGDDSADDGDDDGEDHEDEDHEDEDDGGEDHEDEDDD